MASYATSLTESEFEAGGDSEIDGVDEETALIGRNWRRSFPINLGGYGAGDNRYQAGLYTIEGALELERLCRDEGYGTMSENGKTLKMLLGKDEVWIVEIE